MPNKTIDFTRSPVLGSGLQKNLSITMRNVEFVTQWCNRNTQHFAFSLQLPQIISGLCVEPRRCTFAKYQFKTQCHFSRYACFAIDQFTQAFARHVQILCRLRDAQIKWFKPQFLQHFTRMRGVKLFHCCALVVVQVIDNINIAVFKSKAHTPIGLHSDRPQFSSLPLQWMQSQRWRVNVIKTLGIVKHRQNQTQFFSMNSLNASLIASRIKLFQAFVCETFNHKLNCNLTGFKINLTQPLTPTKMTAPHNEVGFSKPRSKGDNTPIIKSVFLCLSFFQHAGIHIMTALFVGRNPVAPLRDIANSFNAVTRFLAKSSDGFTTLSKGITA